MKTDSVTPPPLTASAEVLNDCHQAQGTIIICRNTPTHEILFGIWGMAPAEIRELLCAVISATYEIETGNFSKTSEVEE